MNEVKLPHVTETPQKAIRTYESDVADVLAHKNISTARIVMDENKKQTGEDRIGSAPMEEVEKIQNNAEPSHILRKSIIALLSLILIGAGVGGAYYFYSISPLAQTQTPQAPQPTGLSSIVPTDKQIIISIDNKNPNQIINLVKAEVEKNNDPGTIKEIIFVKTSGTQKFRVTASEMVAIMNINAPDILLRALSDAWMLGIYTNSDNKKDVFIIATNNYFQNAFAGMLQWENVMPDDFKQYLFAGAQTYPILNGSFTDRIIKNKDVRKFVSTNNETFIYSFIDNSRLVITGKESTLEAILGRLEQKAYVR